VTTPQRPSDDGVRQPSGPLARSIVGLAGTPDDASDIDTRLATIARLAADTLTPVIYASITAVRDSAYTTVAASSDLAIAVDQSQYAAGSGPCLDALADGTPVGVEDMDTTMAWPGFRREAARMGLNASLSVPLFAGSGATIAVLNLYGHDAITMIPLTARVGTVYDTDSAPGPKPDEPFLDAACADLITGLVEAFKVRALIQRAIGVVMATERCTAEGAYLSLRVRAAETGAGLTEIAARLQPHLPKPGGEPGG
jgi:hypothetical protein